MNTKIVISSLLVGMMLVGCGSDKTIKADVDDNSSATQTTAIETSTDKGRSSPTSTQSASVIEEESTATEAEDTKNTEESTEANTATVVSGSVVDGAIWGGKVKIFGLDDGLLAETVSDSAGGYSTTIEKLPNQYKIEVRGGVDIGADGVANENDENLSFVMKAMVQNDSKESQKVAHVTPATTLVADIVEEGILPLDEAQNIIKDGLGLDSEKLALCKLDPRKHDRANKAGNLIALLLKGIPNSNTKVLFKVISKAFVSKTIKIKISNTQTLIEKLDMGALAKALSEEAPDSISLLDVEKLDKCKETMNTSIEDVISAMLPTDKMTVESQYSVMSKYTAFTQLLSEIENTAVENIQTDALNSIYDGIQEAMALVLKDGGLETSSQEQVALIAQMVKANGDQEVEAIKSQLLEVSRSYKATIKLIYKNKNILGNKKYIKRLIRKLYKHANLADLSALIEMLKKNEILEELSKQVIVIEEKTGTGEEKEEMQEVLEKMVASQLSAKLSELKGALLSVAMIEDALKKSLENADVISSIRIKIKIKIKIKGKGKKKHLSHHDKAELIASMQVLESLIMSVKHKDFVALNLESIEDFMEHLIDSIETSLSTKAKDEYEKDIKALELSLANLSKKFDKVKHIEQTKVVIKIIKKIKIVNNGDYYKTIVKIKIKIKTKYHTEIDTLLETLEALESLIETLIVPKVEKKRLIKLPQPSLETLPATAIMIAI